MFEDPNVCICTGVCICVWGGYFIRVLLDLLHLLVFMLCVCGGCHGANVEVRGQTARVGCLLYCVRPTNPQSWCQAPWPHEQA